MYIILSLLITFSICTGVQAGVPTYARDQAESEAPHVYIPGQPIQDARAVFSNLPLEPRRDDFIGERFVAGDTWYDYHTNGSLGRMIAVDPDGDIHITWTDSYESGLANAERHQQYNYYFVNEERWIDDDGEAVDYTDRGGFGCLTLTTDDLPRALAFFHGKIDTAWQGFCGVDFEVGWGVFESVQLPAYEEMINYFPQGVMSPEGIIHIVTQRRDRGMVSYIFGELDEDDLVSLCEFPIEVSQTHRTSFRIACSPRSERAAIAWLYPRAGIPPPDGYPGGAYGMNNDLMLAWTDDGEEWNFDEPLNVTDNIPPNPDLEGDAAYGDTLRCYSSFDLVFDSDDNIHIVFDARGVWVHPYDDDEPPVEGITIDASVLFHWSEDADEITPVADGWYSHREVDDNGDEIRWPTPGSLKSNVCAPSLAYDENGDFYCVFNYYPQNDYSHQDYCNGDIAVTVSEDNGQSWYMPTMITETNSHLADEGASECECYPTLAEVVDDNLHISYELDTEPGSTIADYADREEVETLCPWIYHRVPVDEIEREEIWEDGPNWHADYLAAGDSKATTPDCFFLDPPSPNPFNAATMISYTVPFTSKLSICIYDAKGRLVESLVDGIRPADDHTAVWNGISVSNGIYFVRMEASEGFRAVRKVVLIK